MEPLILIMKTRSFVLLVLRGLLLLPAMLFAEADPESLAPQDSLKALRPQAGFGVELVASEPLTTDPIDFAWGPDGKLWVVEMADYPLGLDDKGKPGGRVRFLEDTDGDGQYDKSTLFVDTIGFPTSVMPWRDGVLILAPPKLFFAKDTDNDGKADTRKVLFTGFGEGNQQHRANHLRWGLDNWVSIANGDSRGTIRSAKSGRAVQTGSRDLRVRPDEGDIETTSGMTQFGRNRDDWGNWFGCNNPNPGWHYVLPDQYLGRNPHAASSGNKSNLTNARGIFPRSRVISHWKGYRPPPPGTPGRFTSACGVMVYRDTLFGSAFQHSAFVSAPVHNLIHHLQLQSVKSTFVGTRPAKTQRSEFLASTDPWFRPTTIRTGPDGALYVADMYRLVLEHPKWIDPDRIKKLDLRAGHERGRIYRIAPENAELRKTPNLAALNNAQLVAALGSSNGWQRDMVHQMLLWRNAKDVVKPLEKSATSSRLPLARMHALCILDGLGVLTAGVVLNGLKDSHAGVRRHAVRLSEEFAQDPAELVDALTVLVKDPDAQVRLQLAFSLGERKETRAGRALGRLLLNPNADRFLESAVMSSALNHADAVLAELMANGDQSQRSRLAKPLMNTLLATDSKNAASRLVRMATPKAGESIQAWQFQTIGFALEWDKSLGGDDALKAFFDTARKNALKPDAAIDLRVASLGLFGRQPQQRKNDIQFLGNLLNSSNLAPIQRATVHRLASLNAPECPDLLLKNWEKRGPTLRNLILDALLARVPLTKALLARAEHSQVMRAGIGRYRRQALLVHPDASIRELAAALFTAASSQTRQEAIDKFRPALKLKGDVAVGRGRFQKLCASCHQLAGTGKAIGPDLMALGDKTPNGFLVAILDPNRAIEARYVQYTALDADENLTSGILAEETANSITFVTAQGERKTLLRRDIAALKSSGVSLMPEGLQAGLKEQDFADLVAFLVATTNSTPRKEFRNNVPEKIVQAEDGSLSLPAAASEVYGPRIIFEQKYRNLGYWTSPDARGEWSGEVTKGGEFNVWMDWALAESGRNTMVLRIAGQDVVFRVPSTRSWDVYRWQKFGTVKMGPGDFRVVAQSVGALKGPLIDLRTIRLLPPDSKAPAPTPPPPPARKVSSPQQPLPPSANQPALVEAEEDGSLRLLASNAQLIGDRIGYVKSMRCIGWWIQATDHAKWNVNIPETRQYDVYLEWAIPDNMAGNRFVIDVEGRRGLTGRISSTGSFKKYRNQKFGSIILNAGRQVIAMWPDAPVKGELADLRMVHLRPAKSELEPVTIAQPMHPLIPIGTAKIDITPSYPVTLAGYAGRRQETDQVVNRLWVRALAMGDDEPAVILAVENCGVPSYLTEKVAEALRKSSGIKRERFLVCSTHTHNAPTLVGFAVGMYGDSLPAEQRQRTARYTEELAAHMVKAAGAALEARKPARLAWTQGMAGFGGNRRALRGERWRGFGFQRDGVVDHSLPLLVAVDEESMPFALVANYACHCTTMGASRNLCGDWAGFASQFMEENHPGAVAMMTIGCGADIGPQPTGAVQHARRHGREIAREVKRLLKTPLQPLTPKLSATFKKVRLPFAQSLPREHWQRYAGQNNTNGYRARHLIKRFDAGSGPISHLEYPIAAWSFGEDLTMVFLGGEVVVDYALLLKQRLDPKRLWVSSYSNDVPCYIPTKRILREGGYEAGSSMVLYGQPSSFAPEVEKIVMDGVQSVVSPAFKSVSKEVDSLTNKLTIRKTAAAKQPASIRPGDNGMLVLSATDARIQGPSIRYSEEHRVLAFWFSDEDTATWELETKEPGKYQVILEWAVTPQDAGKVCSLSFGGKKLEAEIADTGGWGRYRQATVGEVELAAGTHTLVCRSAKKMTRGALMDLRTIALSPTSDWKAGMASADITPTTPILMQGYANRVAESRGASDRIYAKTLFIEHAKGDGALLVTADVCVLRAGFVKKLCASITEKTGLERGKIMVNASHTHAGPVLGRDDLFRYKLSPDERKHIEDFEAHFIQLVTGAADKAMKSAAPAHLSWAKGKTNIAANRRRKVDGRMRMSPNPKGYVDRDVPVLRIADPAGNTLGVLFGCACHCTTLTDAQTRISGDYAGYARQYLETRFDGIQAMFMTGCGGSANPNPRGTLTLARQHGHSLGIEVARILGGKLQEVTGPFTTAFEQVDLPLQSFSLRVLERMARGPVWQSYNGRRMLKEAKEGRNLPTSYRAPVAFWRFGNSLSLIGLPGEIVGEYVPLIQRAIKDEPLWISAYNNDVFGYLPTKSILEEGGYETRGLVVEMGFFSPAAEDVLINKVVELEKKLEEKVRAD